MEKIVSLSSNEDKSYLYYTPIVARIWRSFGYEPFINLVLPDVNTEFNQFILSWLKDFHVQITNPPSNYPSWALAPIIRLFSYQYLPNNSFILLSDIDMLPINKEYFQNVDTKKSFYIIGEDSNTGGYGYSRYPICYIGGQKEAFESLFQCTNFDNLSSLICRLASVHDNDKRSADELLFKKCFDLIGENYETTFVWRKMVRNPGYNGQSYGVPGILPEGRMDRSNWPISLDSVNWKEIIDLHGKRCFSEDYLVDLQKIVNINNLDPEIINYLESIQDVY